ncbi:MAG TPA: serine hydrolase domain-containing protein, partial [Steroidobacteraceae bacterium]|nr:serine hydrolase domain-containing protein [Steroidobacteraceae bacterium]
MHLARTLLLTTAIGLSSIAVADGTNVAATEVSVERLSRIDQLLDQYVADSRIGGAVVLILHDGKPVYEKAAGWSDKDAGRRMETDTLFRIASQTKALTSVVALSLMEEGKLVLNDPVGKFIPEFNHTSVAVKNEQGEVTIVPAKRPITIRDLLTHTAGISYGREPYIEAAYRAKG